MGRILNIEYVDPKLALKKAIQIRQNIFDLKNLFKIDGN